MVCQKPLLVAFRASRAITHDETVDPKEFKKTKEEQRKNEWTAKRMHGQFARDTKDKDKNSTWRWMIKIDLKGCTEALIYSAQEQSIRTNHIKCNIDKTAKSPICGICGSRNETISHIVSETSPKGLQMEAHSVGSYAHWQFCEKVRFNRTRLWYEHEPESVVENKNFKVLWDFVIHCDHMIEARKPDIAVVDKVKKETDCRFVITRRYKSRSRNTREIKKYSLLKDKIARLWQMKKVAVIPILVGALGTITTKFEKYIESLGIEIRTEHVQRSALIGTARIIRKIYFVKYPGKDIAVTSLTFG